MTGRYKAYPEYKESDVEWIKEIPSSWFISDLRRGIDFLTDFEANGSFSDVKKNVDLDADGKYAWYLRATDLQSGRVGFDTGNRTVDEKAYKFLKKTTLHGGELLVAKRGEIGKVYLVPELNCKATLAPNLYLIRLNQLLSPRFSLYWFLSSFGKPQLELANKSTTIGALYKDDVRACQIVYPTFEEQQKIVNFLDHETAKIDTLITKQEKLIELLKEKRQAVISHAVTKGLNPDAPMKNSGVEWLGEVPEHWDVSQLKHHVNTVNGFGFSSNDFQDEGVPFIRAGNIKNKTIVKPDIHLPQSVVDKYQRVIMNAGELVISMVGSDPKIKASAVGQVGLVPLSLAGSVPNQNVVILREKSSLIKQFLFYVVCGTPYRYHLDVFSHKLANQSIISSSLIINAHFAFPTLEEQMQVVDFLDTQLQKYDALVEKAISSIELMKERKTALISAAVTGKIDVRDWKPAENNLVEVA
ncbi:restriction endonuclease subunit S [Vibrio sp. 1069]|uniref:restriction endonuclease subunit S n=1 Tax=Vibrio TaxID=662 RepID=UPI001BD2D1A1|nr:MULTISPECIES: restriction endonuclease subunit S [Vibrio]MBS9897152.1 restriction endonuclease subunit S [Vibrio alginolyticus]MDW2332533.1 restriction endonuclease subunit S [Vibrio sp. 1069]HCM0780946.1 restriction endonuclease subunit S [Vibrio parahaemolyticus]